MDESQREIEEADDVIWPEELFTTSPEPLILRERIKTMIRSSIITALLKGFEWAKVCANPEQSLYCELIFELRDEFRQAGYDIKPTTTDEISLSVRIPTKGLHCEEGGIVVELRPPDSRL